MKRLHDLSMELLQDGPVESMLRRVLEACIALVGARKGTVQLYDEAAKALAMKGSVGFGREFLDQFRFVSVGENCVCGQALARRARVIVEDVFADATYSEIRHLFRREEISAVTSTPLVARDGQPLGMLSTHFAKPHRPSDHELLLLDLYVQQAERIIEFKQAVL
jgi:GAF domain-containing protein